MGYIGEKDKEFLKAEFQKNLVNDVKLIVFISENCKYCNITGDIAKELAELNPHIKFEYYTLKDDMAKLYDVTHAPTVVITDGEKYGGRIRYVGLPSGYEFSSLVEDIMDVSRRSTQVAEEVAKKLETIDKPIRIQVFVTPTCPYCPRAVRTAHKFAILNENITGEMIEAIEFPEWANRWKVMSVPHIVINEKVQFIGAYPDEHFINYVLEAYGRE